MSKLGVSSRDINMETTTTHANPRPSCRRRAAATFLRRLTGIFGLDCGRRVEHSAGRVFSGLRKRRGLLGRLGSRRRISAQRNAAHRFSTIRCASLGTASRHSRAFTYATKARATNDADQFLVLSVNCAHLGCPVTWFPQSGLFMCPCHGGVYYANGEHASGPPPRGCFTASGACKTADCRSRPRTIRRFKTHSIERLDA